MGDTNEKRTVLALSGADRATFLQGLVTNDVPTTSNSLIYSAFLNPQGKYLADFFLLEQDDRLLIDVAPDLAAPLAQRLNMYRLRADVAIGETEIHVSRGTGLAPPNALLDPRDIALGWRAYGETTETDATDWDAIRVAQCIPESTIELIPNDTYILEAGFERLNGVDFKKGCYVGQEVTARMKHKTELKKGLVTVAVTGTAPVGTEITTDGKTAGTLYTQSSRSGIAYLRFARAGANMQAGDAVVTFSEPS